MPTLSRRRGPKRNKITHGRVVSYQHWGCRCRRCTKANTLRCNKWKDSVRSERVDGIHPRAPHGTASGYNNWGCRCDPCKAAGAIQNREAKIKMIANGWVPKPRKK